MTALARNNNSNCSNSIKRPEIDEGKSVRTIELNPSNVVLATDNVGQIARDMHAREALYSV